MPKEEKRERNEIFMNHKKNIRSNKINKLFEMPQEIISNETKITIMGFNQMIIENYKGILEYQDFFVRINTYTGNININGFNLYLKEMTQDDIMVTGKIESIEYESMQD